MPIFAASESSGCAVDVTVVLCEETLVTAAVELTVPFAVLLGVMETVMETDIPVMVVGNAEVITVAPASRRAGPASKSIVGSEQHS